LVPRKALRPTPAAVEREPRGNDLAGHQNGPVATPEKLCPQAPVRAEIIGSDTANAAGFTVRGASPVLALCRKLVTAGFDPGTPLHAYRGDVLCLRVRSIGAAAGLTVDESRTAFAKWKPFSRAAVTPGIAPPKTGTHE
jgi:hypothetical protein